ncbi:MAG: Trk system potassium transporter TrkA [Mogibacterium sp.]|nr:Trk system potassium transporter TrkA [Mogibacterium sp.]
MKIVILGAGKLGTRLVEALVDGDYDVTLVDNNDEKLNRLAQLYDVMTVAGDARTVELLREVGVHDADFLLSATTSDDTNILAASFAKVLGCKYVAARVREPEHMNQLEFIREHYNIDTIINPDLLITGEIYRYLIDKYTLSNGIYTFDKIALIEFEAAKIPELIGKNLIEFRSYMPEFLVIGLSKNGKIIIPHGQDVIESKDLIYLIGEKEAVFKLSKRVHSKFHHADARKVMIIGGGKTGYYLARRLAEYGSKVKIIEQDRQRCHYLTNKLRNVMVLNGDGANIQLLEDEDLDQMDAFVTCTGYDEENLLLALTAKNHGIEDVISKVSHESYKELISKLGIDIVLNPLDISASTLLRTIRGSKRVLSSVLLQGQAEIMEIFASDRMNMLNIPLKHLNLPDYIIIAAIRRGTETIIPDGNTTIKDGDRVIIVCLVSHIGYVEKLTRPTMRINIRR